MSLILPANSLTGGYEIDNSLRFNSGSSDYLSRTYGTPTNNLKYTKSFWVKRSGLTDIAKGFIFSNSTNSNTDYFYFDASDKIVLGNNITPATTAVYRDVSAWYHCVMVFDSANATADDRLILYVNGIRQTLSSTISQNSTGGNQSGVTYEIAHQGGQSRYLDGYLAEVCMIDGQALTPTDFGEFDDSGIWKPIKYTGTYGTNGFYLDFENSGSLGADQSGNGNNFTVNNLTSIDQTTDTPTNNFATLNPLSTVHTENISSMLSNGNVDYTPSGDYSIVKSTIPFGTTGKWYVETKINSAVGGSAGLGIQRLPATSYATNSLLAYQCNDYCYDYTADGYINKGASSPTAITSGLTNWTAGDIVAMLFDADNNEIKWYVNDTLIYTLDLSTAPDGYYINDGEWVFALFGYAGDGTFNINFGNPSISIVSSNSDANGYGNFEYDTKSGYALCTKNLAEFG